MQDFYNTTFNLMVNNHEQETNTAPQARHCVTETNGYWIKQKDISYTKAGKHH
jgi:hypothetical protein